MKIHIFPFSPRTGTPAADYAGQIHGTVRQLRIDELEKLERDLAERYYATLLGQPLEVMIEGLSTREGWVCGTDRRYVPVEVPGTSNDIGKMCRARGIQTTRHYLEAQREYSVNDCQGIQTDLLVASGSASDRHRHSH